MVNCMFDELSFQARLTSEWAYHRDTLLARRSLCCIDLRAVQEDVAERATNDRPGRCDRPEVLRLALVEDSLNDRQRLLLDAASGLEPLVRSGHVH
jgi:hypothetical protein